MRKKERRKYRGKGKVKHQDWFFIAKYFQRRVTGGGEWGVTSLVTIHTPVMLKPTPTKIMYRIKWQYIKFLP